MTEVPPVPEAKQGFQNDEHLIHECLNGNGQAWSALIDRYKNLVFSIPVKYGFSPDDATEIFQTVCLTLLRELGQIRERRALAAWLIRTTAHACKRFRRDRQKYIDGKIDENMHVETGQLPDELVHQLEREQIVREVLNEQSVDCRQLINLLFFQNPPLSYEDAAQALGLAKGSIGATRIRCLEKLRHLLDKRGLRC
jgi:RNA polymerase sigma factor (sigma-70 family)